MEGKSEFPSIIHIERSVFEQFVNHTLRFSEYEWGGLLIGRKVDGELHCLAAILPPQKTQTRGYCEFKRELFPVIYNALEDLETKYNESSLNIITWIHTHPNLGVFLSSTDTDTYTYLAKMNPALSAIVLDPVQYDWLAVNSNPGNLYGYTSIDLNLDYLHDHLKQDQTLLEKLHFFQQRINSERNRKMFKLDESEKIEVFIPIPLDSLKHQIIKSSLEALKRQLEETTKILFSIESEIKIKERKELIPEIQEITDYITYFRAIEQEIRSLKTKSLNRQLFEFNLISFSQFYSNLSLESLIHQLYHFAEILAIPPIFQISLTDENLQYSRDFESSECLSWDSIKRIESNPFYEKNFIYILSIKTGFLKWKRFLMFNPQHDQMIEVLKSKVRFSIQENSKYARRYNNHIREMKRIKRKMEERERDKEEAEEIKSEKQELEEKEKPSLDNEKEESSIVQIKEPEDLKLGEIGDSEEEKVKGEEVVDLNDNDKVI